MFTGLIQEIGTVREARRKGGAVRILLEAPACSEELRVNDSVAVNGACQTVIDMEGEAFLVEAVEETLRKTTLGELVAGSLVNLELPLRPSDRLGGHLVQGHVDCVGTVTGVRDQESSRLIGIEFPQEFARYVVPVGSIAVDGISLTVAATAGHQLTVSLIPHTLSHTTLSSARAGSRVNLEFDMIGKYVERQLAALAAGKGGITIDKLKEWGWG